VLAIGPPRGDLAWRFPLTRHSDALEKTAVAMAEAGLAVGRVGGIRSYLDTSRLWAAAPPAVGSTTGGASAARITPRL